MILIPIRTESDVRRPPHANVLLLSVNLIAFLLLHPLLPGGTAPDFRESRWVLLTEEPSLHQFFTYPFVHADVWHLAGNLLCLWVFGNGVNAKMGQTPYLLFYLAGGVFAGWAHALLRPHGGGLLGASGAIAAVTTAYLVLFPRSRVTLMLWMLVFVQFFELPAILVIVLKIIVWDNVIAPSLRGAGRVAHDAHLAGYLFGFVGAMGMLLIRAIPRDQFDMLALWDRWRRRRQMRAVYTTAAGGGAIAPSAVARGAIAPTPAEEQRWDRAAVLRERIAEALEKGESATAASQFELLLAIDPRQCLSERNQLAVARACYQRDRFDLAAVAFSAFLESYRQSPEADNVRLLLGIIYARDLHEYETADRHLTESWERLRDDQRKRQCLHWLHVVRAALNRPAPQGGHP